MVVKVGKNLKENRQGTFLPVQVVPRGKEFALIGFDEWTGSLKVRLSKPKEKGKANKELLQKLRGFFGAEVEITKGKKAQQKILLVHAEKTRVEKSLSALLKA